MKNTFSFKLNNRFILFGILLIAGTLRLYDLFHIPYTFDEFSSLSRTGYKSYSELVEKGMRMDTHPPFIQVYWHYFTLFFGTEEWKVKLPFIFMGIASIYLIFKIAKFWFNESVGLFAAAFMASSQFLILYAQIARPYGSGVFFCLFMFYFWTKIVLEPQKNLLKNLFLFVIGGSLCAYNHHFSLLLAALVGVAGMFFVKKSILWKYIVAGIVIFLLYVPNLELFFYQLSKGGVGGADGWLGAPTPDFFEEFLKYCFNISWLSLIVVSVIAIYGCLNFSTSNFSFKKFILFLLLFLFPLLIGYFYSVYINPVLQYSVLIFSFPFLFLFLFSTLKNQSSAINFMVVFIILCINTFALIFDREHYDVTYKGLTNVLQDMEFVNGKQSNMQTVLQAQGSATEFIAKRSKLKTKFVNIPDEITLNEFRALVENQIHNKFMFIAHSEFNPMFLESILAKYPHLIWQKNYSGFTSFVFSKFGKSINRYSVIEDEIIQSLTLGTEYCPDKTLQFAKFIKSGKEIVHISIKVKTIDSLSDPVLVGILKIGDETKSWSASGFSNTNELDKDGFKTIHHFIRLTDVEVIQNKTLQTYIWNREKLPIITKDLKIECFEGNTIVYAWMQSFTR